MLEAMASELPPVVTNLAGAKDVITHKINGWLIPPGDVQVLQQGLVTLFNDDKLRDSIGKQARSDVQKNYSLGAIEKQLRNLYLSIIKRKAISGT